jgi:hypothetical protein
VTAVGAFATHHPTLTTATPQSHIQIHIHMTTFELSKKIRSPRSTSKRPFVRFITPKSGKWYRIGHVLISLPIRQKEEKLPFIKKRGCADTGFPELRHTTPCRLLMIRRCSRAA